MLDLGFLPDVERILTMLPPKRQTMLFSATMPGAVISLARRYMSQPTHINATSPDDEGTTVKNTTQFVYRAHNMDKPELVSRILQADGRGLAMIFCRTKRTAADIAEQLEKRGFASGAVHGDLGQGAREQALRAFRNGKVDVLVCTDVAARGIDVEGVTHVINYQSPEDEKTYLHRIGRTGRAGAKGIAVTLVDWDDIPRWQLINKALDLKFPDPPETYSTSPHLFADLGIADGTKGILPRAERTRAGLRAEDLEDLGETGGRGRKAPAASAPAREAREERPARTPRQRRRTRGGTGEEGAAVVPAPATEAAPASDGTEAAGTTEPRAPRRRRRGRVGVAEAVAAEAAAVALVEPCGSGGHRGSRGRRAGPGGLRGRRGHQAGASPSYPRRGTGRAGVPDGGRRRRLQRARRRGQGRDEAAPPPPDREARRGRGGLPDRPVLGARDGELGRVAAPPVRPRSRPPRRRPPRPSRSPGPGRPPLRRARPSRPRPSTPWPPTPWRRSRSAAAAAPPPSRRPSRSPRPWRTRSRRLRHGPAVAAAPVRRPPRPRRPRADPPGSTPDALRPRPRSRGRGRPAFRGAPGRRLSGVPRIPSWTRTRRRMRGASHGEDIRIRDVGGRSDGAARRRGQRRAPAGKHGTTLTLVP